MGPSVRYAMGRSSTRKHAVQHLYTFYRHLWCRVAAAQYGGPIATIRDSRKMILIRGGMAQPIVRIFNCAGIERAHFIWNGGTIVGMGWTVDEKLLLVDIGGEVAVFDIHGRRLPVEFSLGTACMQEKLVNCVVYPAGVVGLTFTNSIWVITDLTDVRPHRLAEIDPPNNPQCMSVRLSEAHGVEVSSKTRFYVLNGI